MYVYILKSLYVCFVVMLCSSRPATFYCWIFIPNVSKWKKHHSSFVVCFS